MGFDVSGSGVIILQLELAKEPYAIAGIFIIQLIEILGHPNSVYLVNLT